MTFPITFPATFKKYSPEQSGHSLLMGVDTSFWDLLIWDRIKRMYVWAATWQPHQTPEIKFHIRKSSQAGFQDPAYLQSLLCIPPALYNTCFHFFDPRYNVAQQANLLITKWKVGGFNLPPVLDVEWAFQFTRKQLTSKVMNCLSIVDKTLDVSSIVYTGPYFWNDHLENVNMNDHPLWVANYDVKKPMLPRGWKDWTIWQYTSKGNIPGLLGGVDMNWGKADKLAALANNTLQNPGFPKLYTVAIRVLNVRSGPSIAKYPVLWKLAWNSQVVVHEIATDEEGNAWGRISDEKKRMGLHFVSRKRLHAASLVY